MKPLPHEIRRAVERPDWAKDDANDSTEDVSNFDGGSIPDGLEEELRSGKWCHHYAYNFCGYVWFADGQFHEEVWQYKVSQEIYSAESLEELVSDVNDKWGYE